MAYRVQDVEISGEIPLLSLDPSGETWVKFLRPRRWETEMLSKYRASTPVLEWDERGQTMRQKNLLPEPLMDSERVCLCLVDSNLVWETKKEGDETEKLVPVFLPGKTCRKPGAPGAMSETLRSAFYEAWQKLPDTVAEAIIEALHDWHPPFDWRNPDRGED